MRTKRSASSRSSATSDSSSRCSRSRVRTVTYFCSALRNTMSRTGTSAMRLRSATDRYSRGALAALASLAFSGTSVFWGGRRKALGTHRLHQIVERIQIEGLHRVAVVRGDEDDGRG